MHVTEKLKKFSNGRKPIDPAKVDKRLQEFNILIDELHKCNFFWSKLMLYNLYIGLGDYSAHRPAEPRLFFTSNADSILMVHRFFLFSNLLH